MRPAAAARANIARVRERYYWHAALAPLIDFVAEPHRSRDAGEVRVLLAAGVDGVITDHPEEALSVVREQAATAVG